MQKCPESTRRSLQVACPGLEDIHALPQVLLNSYFHFSQSVVAFNTEAGTPWQLSQHHRNRQPVPKS